MEVVGEVLLMNVSNIDPRDQWNEVLHLPCMGDWGWGFAMTTVLFHWYKPCCWDRFVEICGKCRARSELVGDLGVICDEHGKDLSIHGGDRQGLVLGQKEAVLICHFVMYCAQDFILYRITGNLLTIKNICTFRASVG